MDTKEIVEKVENGELDALTAYVNVYSLAKELEDVLNYLKPKAYDATFRYPEKTIVMLGYEITRKSVVSYDYSNCLTIKEIEKDLKDAKEIAKINGVHPITGEHLIAEKVEGETIQLKKIK